MVENRTVSVQKPNADGVHGHPQQGAVALSPPPVSSEGFHPVLCVLLLRTTVRPILLCSGPLCTIQDHCMCTCIGSQSSDENGID